MIQTLVAATRQQNDAALTRAFRVVFALFACTALLAISAIGIAWALRWDIVMTVGGVGFIGGMLAFVTVGATFVLTLLAEARVGALCRWLVESGSVEPAEGNGKGATRPAPSAPTPAPAISSDMDTSRGEELHGFDAGDLEWLLRYLANGGKFTEAAMENIPLPYSNLRMGKAQAGTPYTRFMELCVGVGIIVERGGTQNASGKLAVKDVMEMWARVRSMK